MKNNENDSKQKTYFIFIRSTGEKVPVSKEQHDAFYKEADRIRHKEQDHGRCMCPYRYAWKCDGDCIGCEYHAAGDTLSLDVTNPDGNGNVRLSAGQQHAYRETHLRPHIIGTAFCPSTRT